MPAAEVEKKETGVAVAEKKDALTVLDRRTGQPCGERRVIDALQVRAVHQVDSGIAQHRPESQHAAQIRPSVPNAVVEWLIANRFDGSRPICLLDLRAAQAERDGTHGAAVGHRREHAERRNLSTADNRPRQHVRDRIELCGCHD